MNNLDIGGLSFLYAWDVPTMKIVLHILPFGLDSLLLLVSHDFKIQIKIYSNMRELIYSK
jgi:hypothetical protein